ncbi:MULTISPECIES: hypothetical protein [Corynebacterium]|uniref:hypothetical protein n=1 Tax=Corynebacterium TaxID=1716 RepID=UPI0018845C07|nr:MULTISPECIES: hypothetical protein [Corynebacterium]MBF0582446.1 hypothetical protein [Corynebacterium sp. ED61]MDC7105064.1 hypothetical protein [Corynebacterium falsenii]
MGDIDHWFKGIQIVITLGGFIAVLMSLRQKTNSDGRAEWWKRYTWAIERLDDDVDDALFHLGVLAESSLATKTEAQIVQDLLYKQEMRDNEQGDNETGEQS